MLEPSQTRYEVQPGTEPGLELDLGVNEGLEGTVLGIDLGTSNCCCAVVNSGVPTIIDLRDDAVAAMSRSIPSAIGFSENGSATVGFAALELAARRPEWTVVGAKRFVGRSYDSVIVQEMLRRFPYKVVPGRDGRVAVKVDNRSYTLTNLSGRLLKRIREVAQTRLQGPLSRAVITVPAYYNDNQRDAVVQAGRLAGLQVEKILSEPTAAAIAYGLSLRQPRTILVYDLGGGTFDVSVMRVGEGDMRVLACSGDTFLGGNDIDAELAKLACEKYRTSEGKRVMGGFASAWALGQAAEAMKRRLSVRETTQIVVKSIPLSDGGWGRMAVEFSRAELEGVARPFVNRSLAICRSALTLAGLRREDIDDVLLVGGQTKMPVVRGMVEEFFNCRVRSDVNPDEAVALGAALFGGMTHEVASRFKDVLPFSIGLAIGGKFKVVLPRNSPLPCDRRVKLKIPRADYASRALEVWQGENPDAFKNELLGTVPISSLSPPQTEVQRVALHFVMSGDGRLSIDIEDEDTGEAQPVAFRSLPA